MTDDRDLRCPLYLHAEPDFTIRSILIGSIPHPVVPSLPVV